MKTTSDLRTPHGRLRHARSQAGFASAAAFARRVDVTEVTYRAHENGTNAFGDAEAKRYAAALGVSWWWLLYGETAPAGPEAATTVQAIGYVGAGEQVIPFDDPGAWSEVEAPPGVAQGFAVVVRGDSMLPVYRDGDTLFCSRRAAVESDVVGKDCVVQVHDGPRLVKRVIRGSRKGTFRLFSYASLSETDDTKLAWAAPVLWVRRG